jgi:ribonuclease P protein component
MAESGREGRKRGRLSRSGDFDRAYRDGRSHANRYLVLYAFPRSPEDGDEETRLGVSVGRKVGGAVERNKVKRAMREAFWALSDRLPARHDFVLVGRSGVAELVEREGAAGMEKSIRELLEDREDRGGSGQASAPEDDA